MVATWHPGMRLTRGNGRSLGSQRVLYEDATTGDPTLPNIRWQEKHADGWRDFELDSPTAGGGPSIPPTPAEIAASLPERSLTSFGAIGDGSTDDGPAIRTAIASGFPLVVDAGLTFLVNSYASSSYHVPFCFLINRDGFAMRWAAGSKIKVGAGAAGGYTFLIGGHYKPGMTDAYLVRDADNYGTTLTLYAVTPVASGDQVVTLATAGDFQVGDWIFLRTGQTLTNAAQHPLGQFNQITGIAGSVLKVLYPWRRSFVQENFPVGHPSAGTPAAFGIINCSRPTDILLKDVLLYGEGTIDASAMTSFMGVIVGNQGVNVNIRGLTILAGEHAFSAGFSYSEAADLTVKLLHPTADRWAWSTDAGNTDSAFRRSRVTAVSQAVIHIHEGPIAELEDLTIDNGQPIAGVTTISLRARAQLPVCRNVRIRGINAVGSGAGFYGDPSVDRCVIDGLKLEAVAGTGLAYYGTGLHYKGLLSVRDFGAVGDGVTDDTAAFIAAMSWPAGPDVAGGQKQAGRTVWVSPGVYLLDPITIPSHICLRGEGGSHSPSYDFSGAAWLKIRTGKASGTNFITQQAFSSLVDLGICGQVEQGVNGVKMASDSRVQGCKVINWGGFGIGNKDQSLIRVIIRDNGFIEGGRNVTNFTTPQGAGHFYEVTDSYIEGNEFSAASNYTSFKDPANRNSIALYCSKLNNCWVRGNILENADRTFLVDQWAQGNHITDNRFELAMGELFTIVFTSLYNRIIGNTFASGSFAAANTYDWCIMRGEVHNNIVAHNAFYQWSHMAAYNKTARYLFWDGRYPTKPASGATLYQGNHWEDGVYQTGVLIRENGQQVHWEVRNQDNGIAAPTTEAYPQGWLRWNTAPAASGVLAWVCVAAGTPGTWKAIPVPA